MFTYYKNYIIAVEDGKLVVVFDGEAGKEFHSVKVRDNKEYTIKKNKTCLSGQGGAAGVFLFLEKCIRENFMTIYVDKAIENIIEMG